MKYAVIGAALFLLLFFSPLHAQYEDAVWMTGYNESGIPSVNHGYNQLTFERNNDIQIDTGNFRFRVDPYNLSYSDEQGLVLFANACRIMDGATRITALNGGVLNSPGYLYEITCLQSGESYFGWQNSMVLEHPYEPNRLTMFHLAYISDSLIGHPNVLYRTEITPAGVHGPLEVTEKNIMVLADNEYYFTNGINATRHANGRDWWIVLNRLGKEAIEIYLWDGDEFTLTSSLAIEASDEFDLSPAVGQSVFSPAGDIYTVTVTHRLGKVYVNHFDRCSGLMEPLEVLEFRDDWTVSGAAISGSGRFLYVAHVAQLWQFDLKAEDLEASRKLVGVFDPDLGEGTTERRSNLIWTQRAPDGRIYISSTNSQKHFHTIRYPDLEGEACGFEQFGLRIPKFRSINGMPFYPNYHVTAIPGSPCDTLGEGRAPYAKWNYQVRGDTVQFFDLSYYSPMEWEWDFGDGETGSGALPVHIYAEKGTYEVCLRASSTYGSDTFCMEIQTGATSVRESTGTKKLNIYPNPVKDELYISAELAGSWYELVNLAGQRMSRGTLTADRLDVHSLHSGVYLLKVWMNGEIYVGKVVKL